MTQLLERALNKVKSLPDEEQDGIAALILEELANVRCWDATFAGSQDKLAMLSKKVDEDIKAGRVSEVGIDQL